MANAGEEDTQDTADLIPLDPGESRFYESEPSVLARVEVAGRSHTGKVRQNNEDSYLVVRRYRGREILLSSLPTEFFDPTDDHAYTFAVADGMGGRNFGEVASLLALRTGWELGGSEIKWSMKMNERESEELRRKAETCFRLINQSLHDEIRESPRLAGMDPERLVFVDECGANTAMTRTYGRAPVGERVSATTPGHWESITLISGLRLSGVTATLAFPGATNTDVFESYVEQVLVPELKPSDVVIWDNLKPHQSEEAMERVEAAGAQVIPLPPWSPDLTPIEEMISKVKGALRSAARTAEGDYAAFGSALHDVTPENIVGWFQDRAAYAMQL